LYLQIQVWRGSTYQVPSHHHIRHRLQKTGAETHTCGGQKAVQTWQTAGHTSLQHCREWVEIENALKPCHLLEANAIITAAPFCDLALLACSRQCIRYACSLCVASLCQVWTGLAECPGIARQIRHAALFSYSMPCNDNDGQTALQGSTACAVVP
jgi:hypothetical protein